MWRAMLALSAELSGVEMIRALVDGRVPHGEHHRLLGLRYRKADPGRVSVDWTPPAALVNFAGSGVHGGYVAMAFDDVCGSACASAGERAFPVITLNLDIDFLRPVRPDHTYRLDAELVHGGRQRMIVNARVLEPTDTLAAQATASMVANTGFATV